MSNWFQFDRETPDERDEREQLLAEIAAAERAAIEACRQISATAKASPDVAHNAAAASLTHIATLAGVEGKSLWKRLDVRDTLRPRKERR